MAYSRTIWVNDSLPAINAENLNKIENGIVESNLFRNLLNVGNAKISANAGLNFNKTNNQILINGSSTTETNIFLDSPNANKDEDGIILKAGTYTATIKKVSGSLSDGDIDFYLRKSDGESIYNGTKVLIQKILSGVLDDTVYSDTFTLEEETRLHWIGYFAGELRTFNNLVLQFQIEESTSATEYTPFAGYIVESGSNQYGTWTKYSDGTMICSSAINRNITFSQNGNVYTGETTTAIYFPQDFIDNPRVTINTQHYEDYYYCTVYAVIRNKTSITNVTFLRTTSAATVNIPFSYIAIGRWK